MKKFEVTKCGLSLRNGPAGCEYGKRIMASDVKKNTIKELCLCVNNDKTSACVFKIKCILTSESEG